MRLYLSAETTIPDVYIDYIEVCLKNGEEISLTWDESDISRRSDGFDARYKGVYFDHEYANNRLDELEGMTITDIGLYYETDGPHQFRISDMEFEDYEDSLVFTNPELPDCLREELGTAPQPLADRLTDVISKSKTNQTALMSDPERNF